MKVGRRVGLGYPEARSFEQICSIDRGDAAPRKTLPWVSITFKYVNMTDVNSPAADAKPAGPQLGRPEVARPEAARPETLPQHVRDASGQASSHLAPVGEPHLVAMVELLFFAYRDFVAGPDELLAELGFGRAHHRVLHFVARNPGLRVADLLELLKITKQSLARVLKQLIDEGYVAQTMGDNDRRERRLHPTEAGRQLADRLLALQTHRIADALASAGQDAERAAAAFLAGVIAPEDRSKAQALVKRATSGRRPMSREGT